MNSFKLAQQRRLQEAVRAANDAARHLELNADQASDWRAQFGRAISGGNDRADTLHNVYLDYGYPEQLNFPEFWNMYRRFGIARAGVDLPVETCWETLPLIKGPNDTEASATLLRDLEELQETVKFWNRLRALDNRRRVGRYAGMFMRIRDGKQPSEPLEGKLPGVGALAQMIPLYEGQLEVLTVDDNATSETYGMPTMYQFNGGATGNKNNKTAQTFNIHPSRIVIAAEGADNGGIYGIPALEAPYNSLMDLRKIIGAGGEGFYKNAAQNVVFELQDAQAAQQNAALLADFNANYDDFARNRSRRALWTPGLSPHALASSLTDSDSYFKAALNDVAAAFGIPATILTGQQTGRLASDQDSRAFRAGMNSRRENEVGPMITDVIDWCMTWGILGRDRFVLEWDDLLAASDEEKLDNADKMAAINKKQFDSGQPVAFTEDEIREAAGFEPEEMPEPDETIPEDADGNGEE